MEHEHCSSSQFQEDQGGLGDRLDDLSMGRAC